MRPTISLNPEEDTGVPAPPMKIAVFDLDGVLIDSRRAIAEALNATLSQAGYPERPEADLHPFIGPPLVDTFAALTGSPPTAPAIAELVRAYRERYSRTAAAATTVFPGIPELLDGLGATHRLAIATTKAEHLAGPLLAALGLAHHFEVVAGPGPDDLHETKTQTLERALSLIDPDEDIDRKTIAMIGDRSHDVHAALHHGLRAVGVLWGIGDRAELEAAGAHVLVEEPAGLWLVLAPRPTGGAPLASLRPPAYAPSMRIGRDELRDFDRAVKPAPAPIEPVLPAAEEAALIAAKDDGRDPVVAARRRRVLAILRRAAPPEGADAELVTLLAAARALPMEDRTDRLSARMRLIEIGRATDPPPEVVKVLDRLHLSAGDAEPFADALLPPHQDIGRFTDLQGTTGGNLDASGP